MAVIWKLIDNIVSLLIVPQFILLRTESCAEMKDNEYYIQLNTKFKCDKYLILKKLGFSSKNNQ